MSFVPQQDWAAFAARIAAEEAGWLRNLGITERFALYADMFNVVWKARKNRGPGDWEELDRWSWEQKVACRLRCVEAYKKLDDYRNARATSADIG